MGDYVHVYIFEQEGFCPGDIVLHSKYLVAVTLSIRKALSNFFHRHSGLIVKYNIGLKLVENFWKT